MNTPKILFTFLIVALASASQAVPIWDNGGPDLLGGHRSDFASSLQGGEAFTVGTTVTAGQIQWWGGYSTGNTPTDPDDFTLRFFTITAGVPATAPLFSYSLGDVGRVASGVGVGGFDVYAYSATIPDTSLLAGDYLLSIVNNTPTDIDDVWFWATSAQTGTDWFRNFEGQVWVSIPDELAFNLSGPAGVPETGTNALLLGLACLGILAVQRSFRRAATARGYAAD